MVTALKIRILDPRQIPAEWAQRFLVAALGVIRRPPPDRWATVGQALPSVTQAAAAAARAVMAVAVARVTLGKIRVLGRRAVVVAELGLHG
jgi:hypothetical protein